VVAAGRSGVFPGWRRADRLCWAKMIAGSEIVRARNVIPSSKDLVFTQPSKILFFLSNIAVYPAGCNGRH
jgi:hypothetical protein